jgi:cytochrome P450
MIANGHYPSATSTQLPPAAASQQGGLRRRLTQLFQFFRQFVALKRREPGDDLATILAPADIDGRPFTESELDAYFIVLRAAGIVSRDLGIPCVVSVTDATRIIPDGALAARAA